MPEQVAPEEQRCGCWNKDHEQGEAVEPSGKTLKMLSCAQVLALLGHLCPLPSLAFIKNKVDRRGGVKRKLQRAGSLPRTSPSALPVLPKIPGPHLCFPPSLGGVEEVLSFWGDLVEAQGLLPSPRSRHCRQDRVRRHLSNWFIHSFKAM